MASHRSGVRESPARFVDESEALAQAGLEAVARLADIWRLTIEEVASLLDLSPRTWSRIKAGGWSGRLTRDQMLRASALIGIYKAAHLYFSGALADSWVSLPNAGPPFLGRAPKQIMIEGGLPAILQTRDYLDALRGGV